MALTLISGLLGPLVATAETMYVTDQLRLGLHRAEDTGDRPYRTLTSGAALDVIERNRFYAHVKTTDGIGYGAKPGSGFGLGLYQPGSYPILFPLL